MNYHFKISAREGILVYDNTIGLSENGEFVVEEGYVDVYY